MPLGRVVAAAEFAPAAAGGDPAEFLDVHVDHLARGVVDVGVGRLAAHRQSGGLVQARKLRCPVAAQDAVDRRWVQPQVVGDAGWCPAAGVAQFDDAVFGAWGCPVRAVGRGAGKVVHGLAVSVASGPFVGGGGRDLEAFGGAGAAPAVVDDERGQA